MIVGPIGPRTRISQRRGSQPPVALLLAAMRSRVGVGLVSAHRIVRVNSTVGSHLA
jgi:hypothetical protein